MAVSNAGMSKESETKFSLIWEIRRIISEFSWLNKRKKLPKFLLMENIKNIISKKHGVEFEKWKMFLTILIKHN